MEENGNTYLRITNCPAFQSLLWNLPSLAAVLIDRTQKNNFLTIAESPGGMITLLYFLNSSLVILKKVYFFPCLDSSRAQYDNNPLSPSQVPHLQPNGTGGTAHLAQPLRPCTTQLLAPLLSFHTTCLRAHHLKSVWREILNQKTQD